MKLNAKVFLIVMVSILVCQGSIFIFAKRAVHKALYHYVVNDGILELKQMTNDFRTGFHQKSQLRPFLHEILGGTQGAYAVAYDLHGVVLAQAGMKLPPHVLGDTIAPDALETDRVLVRSRFFNDEPVIDIYASIEAGDSGKRLGIVRLGIPMRYVQTTEKEIFNELLLIMVGSGFVTLFLALFFSESILRRVRRLSAGTKCIRDGEYGTVVPVLTQDELSELAENFNAMSRALKDTTVSKNVLQQSEERFRELAENIHEVFWMADLAPKKIIYVSPSYETIWGRKREDLYQDALAFVAAIHSDDRPRVLAALEKQEQGFDVEYRILQPGGGIRWIRDRGFPVQDASGKVYRVAGIAEDITERKQVTDRLQFQNVLLRTQQEVSLDGILVVDPGMMIVSYNRKFAEMWNLSPQTLESGVDEKALQAVTEQLVNPERFLEKVRFLYDHPTEVSQDELVLKNGRFFERYSAPMTDPEGKYYGRVWYFRDITERKRAQQQLILVSTALDQTNESIVITDGAGTIEYVNAAFERTTGYSRTEALRQNPRLLKSGQHPAAFYTKMWSTLKKGDVWEGIFINRRKDGTLYSEETSINPVRNQDGQIAHYVAVKRDVTQRLQMEQIMRRQEKMSAVGQLAAGVAHEINNPLGVILGFAEAAVRRLQPNDPMELPLTSIQKEAIRCKNLVQDLLTFSRTSKVEREPMDINRTVQGALSLILTQAKMTNIEIKQELASALPRLLGNSNQLQQVIINLTANAMDSMGDRGTLSLKTECVQEGSVSWICLRIMDTGPGIPEAVLPRIFEPFFTTKPVGKGTGLGLSLVHEIVQKHSGFISVESRPGRTEFCIRLPVQMAEGSLQHVA